MHKGLYCRHCCPISTCIMSCGKVQRQCRGQAYYFRYADDFVACFQYASEANTFLNQLKERVERFGLELAMDKTRCIAFGRYVRSNAGQRGEKPKEFTFLGFTHYCGKTKRGYFKVKRRTSRKKLSKSRLSGSERGWGTTLVRDKIGWHRRETRW